MLGFCVLVAAAAAAALLLFEFSSAVVGLLGLVPLAIGVHGLVGLRRAHRGTDEASESAVRERPADDGERVSPWRSGPWAGA